MAKIGGHPLLLLYLNTSNTQYSLHPNTLRGAIKKKIVIFRDILPKGGGGPYPYFEKQNQLKIPQIMS